MWIIEIIACVLIIVLVLLQRGKGAESAMTMGAGVDNSLFGIKGRANFLSRATAILATIFFINTVGISYVSVKKNNSSHNLGVMQDYKQEQNKDIIDGSNKKNKANLNVDNKKHHDIIDEVNKKGEAK